MTKSIKNEFIVMLWIFFPDSLKWFSQFLFVIRILKLGMEHSVKFET